MAFLAALIWGVVILRSAPGALAGRQRGLNWLLIAGTIFAWGNFAYEVFRYTRQRAELPFGCPPGEEIVHPLMTPCFYGALIFLTALVISILILRASRRTSGARR